MYLIAHFVRSNAFVLSLTETFFLILHGSWTYYQDPNVIQRLMKRESLALEETYYALSPTFEPTVRIDIYLSSKH